MAQPLATVEGARQLRASLRRAGDNLDDMADAHAEVTRIVLARARQLVPVRSGRLRDTLRGSGTKTAAVARAGYKRLPYGGPIHWGWPSRGIKAQPFLTNAAKQTEPQWLRVYDKRVQRELSKVKGT